MHLVQDFILTSAISYNWTMKYALPYLSLLGIHLLLSAKVPSWNDSLSLPYKWDSGASVSTGSRVFFWGGGLGPKDPVFVFDSRYHLEA